MLTGEWTSTSNQPTNKTNNNKKLSVKLTKTNDHTISKTFRFKSNEAITLTGAVQLSRKQAELRFFTSSPAQRSGSPRRKRDFSSCKCDSALQNQAELRFFMLQIRFITDELDISQVIHHMKTLIAHRHLDVLSSLE